MAKKQDDSYNTRIWNDKRRKKKKINMFLFFAGITLLYYDILTSYIHVKKGND